MKNLQLNNKARIKEISKDLNIDSEQVVSMLLDIYTLEDTLKYVTQIQRLRNSGLPSKKLNDLSILWSYLASIFESYTKKTI